MLISEENIKIVTTLRVGEEIAQKSNSAWEICGKV